MRIAQIIPGLGIHCGGPSRSVVSLTSGLRSLGIEAEIITNNDKTDPIISSEEWIFAIDYKNNRLGYNPRFKGAIQGANYDLFHIHSVFNYSSTASMRIAEKRGIPFVVSPRGSLLKSALSFSSSSIKRFFNKAILVPDLNRAAVLHATSEEERDDLITLGITRPIALIPNSIQLPDSNPSTFDGPFRVGVCGRINPKKNIDGIIRAWSKSGLKNENVELVIIGGARLDKEIAYQNDLHQLEQDLNISNIVWTGPKYGEELYGLLKSLTVMLLGSHSENFGMVVPEALSFGVPVIASRGTPWEVLERTGSGWWIDNSDESISTALLNAYHLYLDNKEQFYQMGHNGIRLVKDSFSQESIASKWVQVYNWILCGTGKPSFVTIID